MPGKNEKEAADNFLSYFEETVSCLTRQRLTAFQQSQKLYRAYFSPPADLQTRSGGRLVVSIAQVFGVIQDPETKRFKVRTHHYSYVLYQVTDAGNDEILAYHWHPQDSAVHSPHLHVKCVPRVHFPTSRVCVEDFVWMVLRYYGARPTMRKSEWTAILEKNKKAFEQMASWKISSPWG